MVSRLDAVSPGNTCVIVRGARVRECSMLPLWSSLLMAVCSVCPVSIVCGGMFGGMLCVALSLSAHECSMLPLWSPLLMAVCSVCPVSIVCGGMLGGMLCVALFLSTHLMVVSVIDCVVSACGATLCEGGASSCPAPLPPIMVEELVR
jgi:hypothetical protein